MMPDPAASAGTTAQAIENRRRQLNARIDYIVALLPAEMRSDPTVHAVAYAWIRRPDFTVEGCLADMVRELVKAKGELMTAWADERQAHTQISLPNKSRGDK